MFKLRKIDETRNFVLEEINHSSLNSEKKSMQVF